MQGDAPMLLSKLLDSTETISIVGNIGKEVNDIYIDSRIVSPNSCYVAIEGYTVDGHQYIDSAIKSGATVVFYEKDIPLKNRLITYIQVESTEKALRQLITIFYDENKSVDLVGVTGTNGKTTVTSLLEEAFSILNNRTGLIGTVKNKVDGEVYPSKNTTPNVLDLHKLLYKMHKKNVKTCFLEVSSHGLALDRVFKCAFKVAIFTNLSQDHLDFHNSMDEYKKAKGKLFSSLGQDSTAIINLDDPSAEYFASITKGKTYTYGILNEADLTAKDIILKPNGMSFNVVFNSKLYPISSNLVGGFNVYNLLAVISTLLLYKIDMKVIQKLIPKLNTVSGRMELITLPNNAQVYVDYAHTPDALENVLKAIHNFSKGKIYTVVGCGGNRDATKRPMMASIAEQYSDLSILTSDNPRQENPDKILNDMLLGIMDKEKALAIVDRKEAIEFALSHLKENDILLIAGKGHENYQVIGNKKLPFDDKEIVENFIKETLVLKSDFILMK
jgi:UDP-N-acetylmuramoyl-L-alanyl-D-glutamate--2,6-diaminopimelate ligase